MQESSLTAARAGNGGIFATDKVVLFDKLMRLGFLLMAKLRVAAHKLFNRF